MDKETATMSIDTHIALNNYSHSEPTGVYPGKMWKMKWHDASRFEDVWFLRWYAKHPTNNLLMCIHSRKIIIMDWEALMGVS